MNDIRWIQRLNNFGKALKQLQKFISKKDLNELEEQGLIQAFEYTHELAWNTVKDFLESQGNKEIYGSKDAMREAFKVNLITNGEVWMDMIGSRNQTSHTYNADTTNEIAKAIKNKYINEFNALFSTFDALRLKEMK